MNSAARLLTRRVRNVKRQVLPPRHSRQFSSGGYMDNKPSWEKYTIYGAIGFGLSWTLYRFASGKKRVAVPDVEENLEEEVKITVASPEKNEFPDWVADVLADFEKNPEVDKLRKIGDDSLKLYVEAQKKIISIIGKKENVGSVNTSSEAEQQDKDKVAFWSKNNAKWSFSVSKNSWLAPEFP